MNKGKMLQKIAEEIARCPLCKKGGTGKVVPGEGNPDARVVFIGEAPGNEESKTGRPFVGRSGKFLRQIMKESNIAEEGVFITSPVHYFPLRRVPAKEAIMHGREHLIKQISVIDPDIIVLLGNTACLALLGRKVEITREHGHTIKEDGRTYFITFHPAYAMRFPEGNRRFARDFRKLEGMIKASCP